MIFFLFFLFYWLGISFRYAYIAVLLAALIILSFLFIKHKPKLALATIGIFVVGVGVSYINIDIKRTTFTGMVIESHPTYFIIFSKGERLYTYEKDNPYEIGDYLTIEGEKEKIHFVSNESQFDFEDYLLKLGVNYQINVKSITTKFSNPIRIRSYREKFLSHFDSEAQSFIKALLFSERDDSDALNNINKLHIARLASASGIFIYSYIYFISFLLSRWLDKNKGKLISLIILTPYIIFTFPRFTVIKIVFFEVFKLVNEKFFHKWLSYLDIVGLSGLFFLLIDHHLGYQTSFLLGFLMPFMMFSINSASNELKRTKKWLFKSILLNIVVIPFEILFHNGTSPLLLVLQVVLSPLFVSAAMISLFCFYGIPIYPAADFLFKGISNLLGWLGKISFQINAPPFYGVVLVIYEVLIVVFCYYRNIKFIPIYKGIAITFLSGLTLYFVPITNLATAQVSFIDVGQGDCCLIRKGTTTVLIDTGGNKYKDIAKESLIPYFQKHRIYNIDLVITTHGDFDHSGALDSLKENFYVKNVVTEASSFPINMNGIVFNNYNTHITEYSDENDKSLVVGFHLINKDFLIMGDAPIRVERNIIKEFPDLKCDILKVGHHGSDTSTCEEFIQFLHPEGAIISCGENNRYGHPKQIVLNILKNNNVRIRRTDLEGTITYSNVIFV